MLLAIQYRCMKKLSTGFTIVELLIVIVVIAILAAISITAFNGIQDRAENAKTMLSVKSYYKALLAYGLDKNTYPDTTNQWCLGENYSCGDLGTNSSIANTALRPYLNYANPLPTPSIKPIQYYENEQRTGAAYGYLVNATLDGQPYPWGISYVLKGRTRCGIDNVVGTDNNLGWPNFTRAIGTDGATEVSSTGNVYRRVILPNPASL